jgi:hypothetical protein
MSSALVVEADIVSETLDSNFIPTQVIAQEELIAKSG